MHSIKIVRKSASKQQLTLQNQGWCIIDVTSRGEEPWCKFSPFYPHENIPIPGRSDLACSVEGIWQGLKVFKHQGIDTTKFNIRNMKNIKRPSSSVRGSIIGHRLNDQNINYIDARRLIYLPAYNWVLNNKLQDEIAILRGLLETQSVALLDYEINENFDDISTPLSHASLIIQYIVN